VEIVRRAADDAHPTRRPDYLVETVWRAIEAGENGEAIEAARDLLRIDPIDGSFIASMVDALAAGGREDEVEALLTSKMEEIEAANISPAEKTERSAALRRGLIPILIGQGRHREALDQFIEIMNRYPDDADLVTEASRHAIDHGLETVLVEYYRSTARQSPSDPRWPIILARVHVEREDYDEAIVAYGLAMAARPERLDLAVARGDLEERTHRFEDAIQTFSIVHTLTREDPVWLERIAVLEARLGRRDAARRTLERAFVEDRPESLGEYARAALVLESVGMMDAAADLIADQASVSGAALSGWESDYARIMTVSRRHEEAFDLVLGTERPDVVRAMGRAVDEYFSPDERVVFGEWLSARRQGADERSRPHFVELASAARLHDLEADWRIDDAIGGDLPEPDLSVISRIIVALEEPRMRFGPLATRLEDLAGRLPPENRRAALDPALGALRTIGDEPGELELIERYPELEVAYQTRYYALLAAARPEELVRVARRGASTSGLMAASALIAAGESDLAVDAIRVDGRTPAWQDAYTGLVGVYFGHDVDSVRPVFDRVLGPSTIGTSLDVARDRDRIIAGDLWFYYGQRYGEYLAGLGVAAADDYLYSVLELRPRDPLAYMELARHFRERGEPDRAITSYRQALELDPDRVDARSEMALAFWSRGAAGDADEARDRWRDALAEFQSHPDPADGTQVIADIRSTGDDALVSELETALGEAMGAAVDSFEVWELPPLVQALFEGSSDDEWLIEVVGQSRAPAQLFSTLASATWPGREQRHVIFENAVRALGDVPGATRFEYRQMRQRYLDFLIDENLTGEAVDLFAAFSAEEKDTAAAEQAGIRLAVLEGTLEELLESYAAEGSRAPSDRTIQETAATLSASGFQAAGGRLSEFLYRRQIAESVANRAAFLGLAEIHLDGGRTDEAIELLRRLDRIAVPPFENLMASARLLIDRGEYPAALEFIERRIAAVPWDADARIAAGQTRRAIAREADGTPGGLSDADLDLIARSTGIPYATRAAAAAEQAESPAGAPGSTGSVELDLLSGRLPLSTTSVNRPFFFGSRLEAAQIAAGPAERLEILLAAIAERPDDTGVRRRLFDAALDAGRYHVALAAYSRSGGIDAEIAVGLAEASLAIGEPADAARFFRTAAAQQTDPDVRLELERRQAGAEETYQRMLDDERRRPMMRDDVDQPNLVQRRLE
jgi:tetratricopeptide (TPR) repeat protein